MLTRRTSSPTVRSELTQDKADALVNAIRRLGLPLGVACKVIGHPMRTVNRWLERGGDEACDDPLYIDFYQRVEAARAERQSTRIAQLEALRDSKGILRLLEADDPETWSQTRKVQIDAEVGAKAALDLSKLSTDELEAFTALQRKAMGGG